MRRLTFLASIAALAAGLMIVGAKSVLADDCLALSGAAAGAECVVNTFRVVTGTFNLDETLRITGTGGITTGGGPLTLNITGGFTMDAGAFIDANNPGGCDGGRFGGTVSITATGAATMADGSSITSNSCSGGTIGITAATADLDGLIESVGSITGTGAKQAPGGGPITLVAGCELKISDTGVVSSRGSDPGADLVHLEGCTVTVYGKVESTGPGHAVPNSPTNHCYYQQAGFPTPPNPFNPGDDPANPRLDKPTNSTACVEVWTSGDLVIDSVPFIERIESQGCNGQINADTGGPGGSSGTSWIDLFAGDDITIYGDSVGPYAVHANGNAGTNDNGGEITVKSKAGAVETFGLAIQANAFGNGGKSGDVDVQAGGDPLVSIGNGFVNFHAASIHAKGANAGGGSQAGGQISARSWNAVVLGTNLTGELNADGGKGKPLFSLGLVTFQGCGRPINPADGVNYTGTVTPPPFNPGDACGGEPLLPEYVRLPICACCLQEVVCNYNP